MVVKDQGPPCDASRRPQASASHVQLTHNRSDHARKLKIVSHIFSLEGVLEFEPDIHLHIGELLKQTCRRWKEGSTDRLERRGEFGIIASHVSWLSTKSRLRRGAVGSLFLGYNYLAFDVIGDLAFGSPFGMLKAAKDASPMRKRNQTLSTSPSSKP
jgi:benzoate 4-monooxygenase